VKTRISLLVIIGLASFANAAVNILRGPYLQSGSPTNITVRWRTDTVTNGMVRYGTNSSVLNQLALGSDQGIEHLVPIQNLSADTKYYFEAGSFTESLAGGAGSFRTSPTNTRPVTVWVIGDSGTSDDNARGVRDAYIDAAGPENTDLWLMLGDNAYGSGTDGEYQTAVFDLYSDILRRVVLWPTLGNHDAASVGASEEFPYLDIFTLPTSGQSGGLPSGTEKYYSFDYANIHFVCLDSESSSRASNSPMFQWLRADLDATEKDWIVAFWHSPPYTKGTHDSDAEGELIDMRQQALPILEGYGVDLVLTGHSHVYERSFLLNGHYGNSYTLNTNMVLDATLGRPGDGGPYRKPAGGLGANLGTVYAVCGCSGQNGGFAYGYHPAMPLSLDGNGSMLLTFNGLKLEAAFLRPSGAVDDSFTVDKTEQTTVRPSLNLVRSDNGVLLSWPTSIPSYSLQAASMIATNTLWQDATNMSARIGRRNEVNLNPASGAHFFRLRSQQ
jgi:hypothetical protein